MVDPWARMISYHFLNQTDRDNFLSNDTAHGAGQLWSHIPRLDSYRNFEAPFPMVVANARPVGSNLTTALKIDATVYEVGVIHRKLLHLIDLLLFFRLHRLNWHLTIRVFQRASI